MAVESSFPAGSFGHWPACPAPERIAGSDWAAHLPFGFWLTGVLRPSLLVELGAGAGVSFCAFCQEIAALGIECNAYAVDLWQGGDSGGGKIFEELQSHVACRYASFASLIRAGADQALELFRSLSIDLLILSGLRDREAILHDFEAWLPKLSRRGVLLLHGICARVPGYGGVAAWTEISEKYPCFAFSHGLGLGIVAAGENAPEILKKMAALPPEAPEAAEICGVFHGQGRIYERLFALEEARAAEVARERAWSEKLVTEIDRLKTEIRELKNAINSRGLAESGEDAGAEGQARPEKRGSSFLEKSAGHLRGLGGFFRS